jgi:transposase-like protein
MPRTSKRKPARRTRRQFSDEFKAGAARLVLAEGKTVGTVARELDLTQSALANWVRKAQTDRTKGRNGQTGVEREEQTRTAPAIKITTIHGTFFPGASWTKPNSKFCRRLKTPEMGDVEVVSFRWSGFNSHRARNRAARQLQRRLHKTMNAHPGAAHFVVGHSHAGNVILYAMRDASLRDRLTGVVCLGTPFMDGSPRDLDTARTFFRILFQIAGSVGAFLVALACLDFIDDPKWGMVASVLALCLFLPYIFLFPLGFVLMGRPFAWLSDRAFDLLERLQARYVSRLEWPARNPPVLVCAAGGDDGDEAFWALKKLRQLTNWPVTLWRGEILFGLYLLYLAVLAGLVVWGVGYYIAFGPRQPISAPDLAGNLVADVVFGIVMFVVVLPMLAALAARG